MAQPSLGFIHPPGRRARASRCPAATKELSAPVPSIVFGVIWEREEASRGESVLLQLVSSAALAARASSPSSYARWPGRLERHPQPLCSAVLAARASSPDTQLACSAVLAARAPSPQRMLDGLGG